MAVMVTSSVSVSVRVGCWIRVLLPSGLRWFARAADGVNIGRHQRREPLNHLPEEVRARLR
jgi:hypothetical protein